ncbi:glycine dehydrogenase (decarboxylating) subunit 2 [Bacillus safensis subsp. safensis]
MYLKQEIPSLFDETYIRDEDAELPEVSELDIMRHYTALSRRNHGVDSGFYPLGSCTMKYNPKINEKVGEARIIAGSSATRGRHCARCIRITIRSR